MRQTLPWSTCAIMENILKYFADVGLSVQLLGRIFWDFYETAIR